MKELYRIKISGPVCCGKTTRAWEIFEEREVAGLSTVLIDEGRVRGIYRGLNPDYVTIEVSEAEGHELKVTEVK